MAITPISWAAGVESPSVMAGGKKVSFADHLNRFLDQLEQSQNKANATLRDFLTGEAELHTVMIAAQEARLWLELSVQLRNKLVESYQEISRMQI
ncbi:flagellar hook-basal body complex protein FliE [Desulfothermobacter acidiphilus]|uniref:flagellar hook-basal body complex protein FliE n=1 Tax=Desulfothermobacter acidiphilus TaxID=1938353 RepID=UPI003F8B0233